MGELHMLPTVTAWWHHQFRRGTRQAAQKLASVLVWFFGGFNGALFALHRVQISLNGSQELEERCRRPVVSHSVVPATEKVTKLSRTFVKSTAERKHLTDDTATAPALAYIFIHA